MIWMFPLCENFDVSGLTLLIIPPPAPIMYRCILYELFPHSTSWWGGFGVLSPRYSIVIQKDLSTSMTQTCFYPSQILYMLCTRFLGNICFVFNSTDLFLVSRVWSRISCTISLDVHYSAFLLCYIPLICFRVSPFPEKLKHQFTSTATKSEPDPKSLHKTCKYCPKYQLQMSLLSNEPNK